MQLSRCKDWIQTHREFFLELIRIYLGLGLFIKGVFFLANPGFMAVSAGGGSLSSAVAVVPFVHMIGGLLLAAGFFARLAALSQIPVLFGATFFVNLRRMEGMGGREGIEFSALVLFLLVLFAVRGSGSLSLERFVRKSQPARPGYDRWIDVHPDLFMDLIRAYLGLGLFLKGFYILHHESELMRLVESSPGQMPLGVMMAAHYVIPAHFAGGAMLLLGLGTRIAAAAQIPLLVGAVFYVYLPRFATLELRQNLEFSALVLFLLCIISAHGPGRYSLDFRLRNEEERESMHLAPAHS